MLKIYAFGVHNIQQNLEGNNNVRIDDGPCCIALFLGETSAVNNAHLLDDRRLARLSGTWYDVSI